MSGSGQSATQTRDRRAARAPARSPAHEDRRGGSGPAGEQQQRRAHVPGPHRPQQQHDQRETQRRVDCRGRRRRRPPAQRSRRTRRAAIRRRLGSEADPDRTRCARLPRGRCPTARPCRRSRAAIARPNCSSRAGGRQDLDGGRGLLERGRHRELLGPIGRVDPDAHDAVRRPSSVENIPKPPPFHGLSPSWCARITCSAATATSSAAGSDAHACVALSAARRRDSRSRRAGSRSGRTSGRRPRRPSPSCNSPAASR